MVTDADKYSRLLLPAVPSAVPGYRLHRPPLASPCGQPLGKISTSLHPLTSPPTSTADASPSTCGLAMPRSSN